MASYSRLPVAVEAVRWTGDVACLADSVFSRMCASFVDRADGRLTIRCPGHMLLIAAVDDYLVYDGMPHVVSPTDFAAQYVEA